MTGLHFRRLRPDDPTGRLLALYRRSISGIDDGLYSPREKRLWIRWARTTRTADRLLRQGITLLAEEQGQLKGFGQLYPDDLINMLYVDPGSSRQGVGTGLVRVMEQIARQRGMLTLNTRASHASRAVFLRAGFSEKGTERVHASTDVCIDRTVMHKPLSIPGGGLEGTYRSVDDNGSADGLVITQLGHKQHLI